MADPTLDDLARMLAQHLLSDHSTFCRQLMQLLAERAQPVSLEVIATTLHVSAEEIAATVRQIPDLEFDEAGHLVGMGLSLMALVRLIVALNVTTLGDLLRSTVIPL
jgi:hypothetical protein